MTPGAGLSKMVLSCGDSYALEGHTPPDASGGGAIADAANDGDVIICETSMLISCVSMLTEFSRDKDRIWKRRCNKGCRQSCVGKMICM